jgi:hypothetical protein
MVSIRFHAGVVLAGLFVLCILTRQVNAGLVDYVVIPTSGSEVGWSGQFDIADLNVTGSPLSISGPGPSSFNVGHYFPAYGPDVVKWWSADSAWKFEVESGAFLSDLDSGSTWSYIGAQTYAFDSAAYLRGDGGGTYTIGAGTLQFSPAAAAVPEPSSTIITLAGLTWGGWASYRRKRRSSGKPS